MTETKTARPYASALMIEEIREAVKDPDAQISAGVVDRLLATIDLRAGEFAEIATERERLYADVAFLLDRAKNAGTFSFGSEDRDFGVFANSLVSVAYGVAWPACPQDASDLAAAYRCLKRLPIHRVTQKVRDHLVHGENYLEDRYFGSKAEAMKRAGWPGWR